MNGPMTHVCPSRRRLRSANPLGPCAHTSSVSASGAAVCLKRVRVCVLRARAAIIVLRTHPRTTRRGCLPALTAARWRCVRAGPPVTFVGPHVAQSTTHVDDVASPPSAADAGGPRRFEPLTMEERRGVARATRSAHEHEMDPRVVRVCALRCMCVCAPRCRQAAAAAAAMAAAPIAAAAALLLLAAFSRLWWLAACRAQHAGERDGARGAPAARGDGGLRVQAGAAAHGVQMGRGSAAGAPGGDLGARAHTREAALARSAAHATRRCTHPVIAATCRSAVPCQRPLTTCQSQGGATSTTKR